MSISLHSGLVHRHGRRQLSIRPVPYIRPCTLSSSPASSSTSGSLSSGWSSRSDADSPLMSPGSDTPTSPTVRVTIMVCINAGCAGQAARNDIHLFLKAAEVSLRDRRNSLYLLTDYPDVIVPSSISASVCILPPTRKNTEVIIRSATRDLQSFDRCHIWFSCKGLQDDRGLQLLGSEMITGDELYRWMTDQTDLNALIQVGIDSCHSGSMLGLPWCFSADGQLKRVTPHLPRSMHRMIVIAACASDQFAHQVGIGPNQDEQWGGLLWHLAWEQLEGHPRMKQLGDIQRGLAPLLSKPGRWTQTPQVSLSFFEKDAPFCSWF